MGRRKRNETEADDEEGKRLMLTDRIGEINLHVTHQRTTRSLHRVR